MKKITEILEKYGIYLVIFCCLALGLLSLTFKNATLDDDLYLWETSMMTETMSRGEWFGDYAVGTHGFLFKLPVALIFLLTGPSLAIATVWNVLLACFALFIFYRILTTYFPRNIYPILGVILMFCNFQFILNLPTYMREFPVLVGMLVLIYALIKKRSLWIIGLSLLLILEGKEYVFFMIVPALLIYVIISQWKGINVKTLVGLFKGYTKVFLPSAIFFLLMIFTSIIPLNMYGLSVIPGITKGGTEYHVRHFDSDIATTNKIDEDATSIQKTIDSEDTTIEKAYKTVVSYIGKILYPRSFSFLSIPKIILFPSFLTSILLFAKAYRKRDSFFISFSLIYWSFLSIFILRASFDRYLFPLLPVVVFFFLLFIKELVKERNKFFIVVTISGLLSLLGLLFEVEYIWIKFILNIFILAMYFGYYYLRTRIKYLEVLIISVVSLITFCIVIFFFYANGQLHQYLLWGHDYEVREVVTYFKDDEKVMFNDVGWDILVKVYRGDNRYNPEWKWELQDWVPRKKNLKMLEKFTSYGIYGKSVEDDRILIESVGIEKIGLMVSEIEDEPFRYETRLEEYLEVDWLKLINTVEMKNKRLYIFEVVY